LNVKATLLGMLVCLWSLAPAQQAVRNTDGPSFDCERARGRIEKQICADAQLSVLDKQVADLFTLAMTHAPNPTALRREHRRWQRERDTCRDAACLTEQHRARLRLLRTYTGRLPESTLRAVCTRIASADTREETLAQTRGSEDINNDGIAETMTGCAGGTANVPCVSYVDDQQRPVLIRPHGLDWTSTPVLGRSTFRFEDHTYIYYSRDAALNEPAYLAFVTPTNRELRLCEFETHAGSAVIEGGDDVCLAIEDGGEIETIEWTPAADRPLPLTRENAQLIGIARVDVDNDRLDEVVAKLQVNANGCTFDYFELLTDDAGALLTSSKARPLRELQALSGNGQLGRQCGRLENRWFKFDDKIYYETNATNEDGAPHEVRVLDGTAVGTLCTFERRVATSVKRLFIE
jgi:uncharacterized protein